MLHGRQRKRNYDYILDKAQQRLAAWQVDQLSFAGRITLTQSVLAVLPTYTMQTTLLPKGVCRELERMSRGFIWGAKNGERKWHSVSWNAFLEPKENGGLGMKDLHKFNNALIMKLGWGLIARPEALWVRVLHSKYDCGYGMLPRVEARKNASNAWRRIVSVWKELFQGVLWVIGNGESTRFWLDAWLPSRIILKNVVVSPIPEEMINDPLSEYSDYAGQWCFERFQHYIPPEILGQFYGCMAACSAHWEDSPTWGPSPNGQFSTKSAYQLITGAAERSSQYRWRLVWKWGGPHRVKNFLWLVLRGDRRRTRFVLSAELQPRPNAPCAVEALKLNSTC